MHCSVWLTLARRCHVIIASISAFCSFSSCIRGYTVIKYGIYNILQYNLKKAYSSSDITNAYLSYKWQSSVHTALHCSKNQVLQKAQQFLNVGITNPSDEQFISERILDIGMPPSTKC